MTKEIVFDLYGTLVDEMRGYREFIKSNTRIAGSSDSLIKSWFQKQRELMRGKEYLPFEEILCISFAEAVKNAGLGPTQITNFDSLFSAMVPFQDAQQSLPRIKEKYKVCVLTNSKFLLVEGLGITLYSVWVQLI